MDLPAPRLWRAALLLALLANIETTAKAASITYVLDRVIPSYADEEPGASISVAGTVTTDGTLGAISRDDVEGWDVFLTKSNSPVAFNLTPSNSTFTLADDLLSATATELIFDFGSFAQGSLEIVGTAPDVLGAAWHPQPCVGGGSCTYGVDVAGGFPDQVGPFRIFVFGQDVVGTVLIPEPATAGLCALGLLAVATWPGRRARQQG